jgi:hypothetical protein
MVTEATASPDTEPPTWARIYELCLEGLDDTTDDGPPLTAEERETVLANHRGHAGAVGPASGQAGPVLALPPNH